MRLLGMAAQLMCCQGLLQEQLAQPEASFRLGLHRGKLDVEVLLA